MTELAPLTGSTFLNVVLPIVLLAIVTIGLHILMGGRGWSEHRTGLWPLIVGEDRRLSTSKVQLMLWTFAIVLALLLLLVSWFWSFTMRPIWARQTDSSLVPWLRQDRRKAPVVAP
jgi:hypothetical protein